METINFESIPAELRDKKAFVNWKMKEREKGKKTKIPVDREGKSIDVLDTNNQLDFETAKEIYETYGFGIGFVIDPKNGLVGIDIDHCVDQEGNISPLAQEILESCDSYAEFSPSGNGIHIWIMDSDIDGIHKCRNNEIGLEIYREKRYFTVTGDHIEGTSFTVMAREGVTRDLVGKYIDNESKNKNSSRKDSSISQDDQKIINLIRKSKQGCLFHELFDLGKTDKYGGDDSSADMALMDILPFWTHGNHIQMERIFSMSALAKRDKWLERQDYRDRTIQAALSSWDGISYMDPKKEIVCEELDLRCKDGNIVSCAENFETILTEDSNLSGVLAYNIFENKIFRRKPTPWNSSLGEWTDTDDAQLRSYISRKYNGLRNKNILYDSITVISKKNEYHPVREYFSSLDWDGIQRANSVFIDALNVKDDMYVRIITWYWLLAAVKRIMEPGCKFDYCLVLSGPQGTGKSTVLNRLGKSWFNDSISTIEGKDALLQLHSGSWIIELGEMQATRKCENELIKSFISRNIDIVRMPYDKRPQKLSRSCVFAGTTNDTSPLRDNTGGRRFWILISDATCSDTPDRLSILTDDYIDQIWAEVYYAYQKEKEHGEVNLLPPRDVLNRAMELQEKATDGSEIVSMIEKFLNTRIPKMETWNGLNKNSRRLFIQGNSDENLCGEILREYVCLAEIANELFQIDNILKDKKILKEIREIMDNQKGWKKLEKAHNMGIYGSQRNVYQRIEG